MTKIDWPLNTFRSCWTFNADGESLTSESTLRFRQHDEIEADLIRHGYSVLEARDRPGRPGREFVFLAQRRQHANWSETR